MELNELDTRTAHNAGAEMTVQDQYGKDTDIVLTVVGKDSDIWRKLERTKQVSMLAEAAAGKLDEDGGARSKAVLDMLAGAVLGWRGVTEGGKPLEFSADNIRKLLVSAPYVADQVDRFIAQRVNFSKG